MNCASVTPQSVVVCRLCTKSHEYYVNIFISNESCEIMVEEAIQDLLGLPVGVGDGLPNVVCRLCLRKLIEFREFKNMCFKSATELRAYALGNDFLVSKDKDEDSADVETSRGGSNQKNSFLNDIHVTEVYLTTPDELAIGNVSHSKEDLWSSEKALVVKEEVNDGGNYAEDDVPVTALANVAVDPLAVDTMVSKIKDEDAADLETSRDGSNPENTFMNDIHVTEMYISTPDELAIGNVSQAKEEFISSENVLVVKEEVNDGEHGIEGDMPMTALASVAVDPLAVNTMVDCCGNIGGIPEVPEIYLDNFVSGTQGYSQNQLPSNSSYDHMREENLQFEYSMANSVVAYCQSRKIVRRKEKSNPCDANNISSLSNDVKQFKCDSCGKYFRHSSDFKRHFVIHTGVEPCKCNVCGKNFAQKSNLKKHLVIHTGVKPYKCAVCDKTFTRSVSLATHSVVHTGEKPFKCNVCGKNFTEKRSLRRHLVIHTGVKPYNCDVCGKMFTQKGYLKSHYTLHTGVKPFACKVCGKNFREKSSLKKHLVIHTGVKPFKCNLCGKNFTQKSDFRRHLVIHTGEKLYKCDLCGKEYKWRRSLRGHLLTHADLKPPKSDI